MQEKQLLREIQHEVTVSAYGNTLEDTVGKIFQLMRQQIFKDIGKPVIQMEAEEVYFDKVETDRKKERFMFLFWPREKVSYTITARIVVKLKYLNVTKEDL